MPKSLEIHVDSGQVHVVGSDDAPDERRRTVELGEASDVVLMVAPDCRVAVHGDSVELRVEGVGGLEVHVDSGEVEAMDIDGDVEIHADSAEVALDNVIGNVEIHTDSGGIEALRIRGRVEIHADSSDVTVQAVSDRVEVCVDSGEIVLDLVPVRRARYEASTDSGAVTIRLPADVGVRAELESDSGEVVNDARRGDDVHLEVTTDSGDITILGGVPALADGVFRRGDLRLFLLGALEDGAKHGYELMRLLEDRFAGLYRPSAGSIYPRLGALVDSGLVEHEGRDYSLTDAGKAEVDERRAELRALERSISAGTPRRSGHALRAEVRAAAAEVRAQQRRVNREERQRGASLAALRLELRVFSADVLAAARRADADSDAIAEVVRALDEARATVVAALAEG